MSSTLPKIRVLVPFSGDSVGGSYLSALTLIKTSFKHQDISYEVALHGPGPLEDKLQELGMKYQTMNLPWLSISKLSTAQKLHFPFSIASLTIKLVLLLRRGKYDAVHVHDGRMALTWAIACKIARKPLIIHQRTKFSRSRFTEAMYGLSTHVLAITKFVAKSLPSTLLKKTTIISNPVVVPPRKRQKCREALRRDFELDLKCFLIALVGTHQPQKRQTFALDVAAGLRKRGIDNFQLVFMGRIDTKTKANFNEKIKIKALESHCFLTGYVDAYQYLAGFDLLFAPAVDEGFGRTLIEAIGYGVPVLASASGGHMEILSDNHRTNLFTPDDLNDCIQKLSKLLATPVQLPTITDYSAEKHYDAVLAETIKVVGR